MVSQTDRQLKDVSGIGPKRAEYLHRAGYRGIRDLQRASVHELTRVESIHEVLAKSIKEQVGYRAPKRHERPHTTETPIDIALTSDRVFDRIASAYDELAAADERLPRWGRETFIETLRAQTVPYEAAAGLTGGVIRNEPAAEPEFRELLGMTTPQDPGHVGYTPLPEPGGGELPCEFVGGEIVGGLYFTARLIARSEDDWTVLRDQVTALYESSEWIESIHSAARHYETTGDARPLSVRMRLFERAAVRSSDFPIGPSDGDTLPPGHPIGPERPGGRPSGIGGGGWGSPGGLGGGRPPLDLCQIHRRACVHDLIDQAERGGQRAASRRPSRAAVWSDSITSVSDRACSGEDLVIRGSGFGDGQPDNVTLLLPAAEGCRPATVPDGNWTDTEIRLPVPTWMRAGCIGFRDEDLVDAWGEYYRTVGAGLGDLASTSMRCRLLGAKTPLFTPKQIGYTPGCPPCTAQNRFEGTVPEIHEFEVEGDTEARVTHDATVTLSWDVANATAIEIMRVDGPAPQPNVTRSGGPDFTGTKTLALSATRDSETVYRLEASNGCGSVDSEVRLIVRRTPDVSIAGIEVVQAVQTLDFDDPSASNALFLVEGKRTMVRVYVDSGLPATYNNGGALPVSARAETVPLSGQSGTFTPDLTPLPSAVSGREARAAPTRLALTDSINFELPLARVTDRIRIRITVEPDDEHARWTRATDDVTVEFITSPTLDLVPMRVFDDFRVNRATTAAELNDALRDMRAMYPLAGDRLRLWSTGGSDVLVTNRDYNTDDAWDDLLDDLEEIAEDFADNGEIWCAAVPSGARTQPGLVGLAIQGAWWWYSKASWDSSVVATPAHEVGHSVGFGHSTSRTGEIGMHVPDRTVKDAQRPELMAQVRQFNDPDRWPGPTFQQLFYWGQTGVWP